MLCGFVYELTRVFSQIYSLECVHLVKVLLPVIFKFSYSCSHDLLYLCATFKGTLIQI